MSEFLWGIIGICLFLVFIFLKMPIGFAGALVGFLGICVVRGVGPALSLVAAEPFRVGSTYVYSVIPLFILMGYLAAQTGLSANAFYTLNKWVGHMRGGLAMATTGACAIFGAICGDPISTATTMTAVALPEMRKHKYHDRLSLGILAASGNLGFMIPPSLAFIVYAILTEQSIGTLFIAGIVPGLLLALFFIATIWIICRINPVLAPQAPKAGWMERLKSIRGILGILIIIVLVLGGIYAGIFTPTEAGSIGVAGVLLLGLANRQLKWQDFGVVLRRVSTLLGMVFVLIIGAMIFSRFMAVSEISLKLGDFMSGLDISRYYLLVAVLIFYALAGLIMDIMGIMMIVAPILHPIIVGLGFDPVWLAVLTVAMILMGGISPPVGMVVFALSGMVSDAPLFTIYRGVFPFIVAMLVCLVILIAFPQIVLWLPGMMRPG
jgi:C4-dicarboxylate transporter DctM subunit